MNTELFPRHLIPAFGAMVALALLLMASPLTGQQAKPETVAPPAFRATTIC